MGTLFLLPNELLYQVMDETIPDRIEGLSLTCKDLYRLARPYLEQHRANKRRYSTINLLAESSIVLFHLLEEILSTPPRVVLYPKIVILGPRDLNRTAMDPARHTLSKHSGTSSSKRDTLGCGNRALRPENGRNSTVCLDMGSLFGLCY